jgi:hypothetical protein
MENGENLKFFLDNRPLRLVSMEKVATWRRTLSRLSFMGTIFGGDQIALRTLTPDGEKLDRLSWTKTDGKPGGFPHRERTSQRCRRRFPAPSSNETAAVATR